jgi:hypothetical protein
MSRDSKRKTGKSRRADYFDRRDQALARVVAVYKKGDDASDELTKALDALTIAHVCATFDWADGPLKW